MLRCTITTLCIFITYYGSSILKKNMHTKSCPYIQNKWIEMNLVNIFNIILNFTYCSFSLVSISDTAKMPCVLNI